MQNINNEWQKTYKETSPPCSVILSWSQKNKVCEILTLNRSKYQVLQPLKNAIQNIERF